MNISFKLNIVLTILIFLFACTLHAENLPETPFTVVIDPGHGGKDPGAVFKNIREKDVVLNIGLKLGDYIKQNLKDVKIVYTRQTDVFVPLHQRAEIANKSKADLFISLHANYCGVPSISGTETFVLGLHRSEENLEVAKKENSVILLEDDYSNRYQGFDPNQSESYIMFEMVQDDYIEQSINLAANIQTELKDKAQRRDRSVKQAGFLVLRRTSMPSVLVETGFLSNPTEAGYLNSSQGQSELASAIYQAVRNYKASVDNRRELVVIEANESESIENKPEKPIKTPSAKTELPTEGIYFSIQLAASSSKIAPKPENFGGLKPVFRKAAGKLYKYFYGQENSFEKINQLKTKAQRKYPDAFIVAFENDEQISVKKALRKLED